MADNFQLPIPTTMGDVSAGDDIGGVKYQRIKVTLGADGVNDGDVSSANPLPIAGTQADGATATGGALIVAGVTAGGVVQHLETNASGHLNISDGGGSITIDAASLPLPTGAATESTLSTISTNIADIETLLGGTAKVNNAPLVEYTGAFTAANQEITIDGTNIRSLLVQARGTFSATAVVEGRNDASGSWATINGFNQSGTQTNMNIQTILSYSTYGMKFIRIRCSSYTSGTMNIVAEGYQETDPRNAPSPVALSTSTLSVGAVQRAISATTNGVTTFHHLISAATTNATSVKASAGTITSIILSNTNAAARFFKLYNKASAPTVGTDTPIMTVMIPAGQTIDIEPPVETRLTSGIAYALTTGIAVADTGAVGASDISVHISYV